MITTAAARPFLLPCILALGLLPGLADAQEAPPTNRLLPLPGAPLTGQPLDRLIAGDLDGDGLDDLLALRVDPDGALPTSVLRVRQLPTTTGLPAFAATEVIVDFALDGPFPVDLALADIDGDGDLDLLVALLDPQGSDALGIWLNQGGAQGGEAGRLARTADRFAFDMVSALAVLDSDGDPTTPPDVLLVRPGGPFRPSALLRNSAGTLTSGEFIQSSPSNSLAHYAVVVADVDGDGLPDLLFRGGDARLFINQGPPLDGFNLQHVFSPPGGLIGGAAVLPPRAGAAGAAGLLLATHDGREHLFATDGTLQSLLDPEVSGFTQHYLAVDADGDGLSDLLALRNERRYETGTAPWGSPVWHTLADPAPLPALASTPLQRLPAAVTGTVLKLGAGDTAIPAVLLVDQQPGAQLWTTLPIVEEGPPRLHFGSSSPERPLHVFTRLTARLHATPPTTAMFRANALASVWQPPPGLAPPPVPMPFDFPAGAPYANASQDLPSSLSSNLPLTFHLQLGTLPPDIEPGSPADAWVRVHREDLAPNHGACNWMCGALADCGRLSGESKGDPTGPLDILFRLRNERVALHPSGAGYLDQLTAMAPDLYRASLAHPGLPNQLSDLVAAWRPALLSLLDGDGSVPVDAAMRDALLAVFDHYVAFGSTALRQAAERERRALRLGELAGQTMAEFARRWESQPVFGSGFE